MTFTQILEKIKASSEDNLFAKQERKKGTFFEKLTKVFLATDERYNKIFGNVKLWSELDLPDNTDIGIDLIATDLQSSENTYVAIQCKCYSGKVYEKDLSTFMAASSRSHELNNGEKIKFSKRLVVYVADGLSNNAEKILQNQEPPVTLISQYELQNSQVDWSKFNEDNFEITLKSKFDLKTYQKEAINAVKDELTKTHRTQLIMACGTGKTLTALRLVDDYVNNGEIMLFLAPSIALINQSLQSFCEQSLKEFTPFVVCSDSKVGNNDEDEKSYELPIAPTTNPANLAKYIDSALKRDDRVIIFSTYQSIEVVMQMQEILGKEIKLAICDEAHRTVSVKSKDSIESDFSKIHSNENIKVKKRLYMTATPRIFAEKNEKSDEIVRFSMDDESIYGKEAYRLNFDKALQMGELTDYKVIITLINQNEINDIVNANLQITNEKGKRIEVTSELAAKIVGTYKALTKDNLLVIDDEKSGDDKIIPLKNDDNDIMRSAILFNSSIVNSKERIAVFDKVIDTFLLQNGINEKPYEIDLDHIDGSMNANEKNKRISELRNKEENKIKILSNARVLTEGVDVKDLDAVVFLDTRNSMVDIVQAVGRVMRKAEGKEFGYIILPVLMPENEAQNYDTFMKDSAYKGIWKMLRAIRSHDERLVSIATIQNVVQVVGTNEPSNSQNGDLISDPVEGTIDTDPKPYQGSLKLYTDIIHNLIPKKLGDLDYWKDFAISVAEKLPIIESRINALLNSDNEKIKKEFAKFLANLQENINKSIDQNQAVMMISQHIITKPIFDILFPQGEFSNKNPISKSMSKIYEKLLKFGLADETAEFSKLYASIEDYVTRANTDSEKQEIIKNLYDSFFKEAFKKEAEKLGIVYTPIAVVDFIINSVDFALKKHFNESLCNKNVKILDPFAGTSSFLVRLIQSGLIDKNLDYKYQNELFANEITLLAYYISTLNLSAAYHERIGKEKATTYKLMPNLLFTDTFQMSELEKPNENVFGDEYLDENEEGIKRQIQANIKVIIGNPPYSVGQGSANDNNKNLIYPKLQKKLVDTYIKHSSATKNNYDSYKLAIRYATDRIGECGVIGFVTNGSFIDTNSDDGLRHCLEDEFSYIYIFNLRGNQRTSGEESKKEGGKIFGSGSRAPVAISILIKDPNFTGQKAEIYYYDIGDYLDRNQKLDIIKRFKSVENIPFTRIVPNQFDDWINHRDESFDKFMEIGDKKLKFKPEIKSESIFEAFSMGISTSRDVWVYNFSKANLEKNMTSMIENYNYEVEKREKDERYKPTTDKTKVNWSRALTNDFNKKLKFDFKKDGKIITSLYRPFTKCHLYLAKHFNEMLYQMPKLFPPQEKSYEYLPNLTILVNDGSGNFGALITDKTSDNHTFPQTQAFPLYYYEKVETKGTLFDNGEEVGYQRKDAIRNYALSEFQKHYDDETIGKEDIFYYIYALLHNKAYIAKYKNNLTKSLPRIPFAPKFWEFSKIGRELANLHLNYESIKANEQVRIKIKGESGADLFSKAVKVELNSDDYRVKKMKFGGNAKNKDKSVIIYNDKITLENVPLKAYDYVVNGKSAIEWIMERYCVSTDKDSGIKNDANLYSDDPKYILNLLLSVIEVSVKSVDLINALPSEFCDEK